MANGQPDAIGACGGARFTIEDPAGCGAVLDEALAAPGLAIVDPNVPPIRAMVNAKQVARLAGALARATGDAGGVVRTVVADKVRELV